MFSVLIIFLTRSQLSFPFCPLRREPPFSSLLDSYSVKPSFSSSPPHSLSVRDNREERMKVLSLNSMPPFTHSTQSQCPEFQISKTRDHILTLATLRLIIIRLPDIPRYSLLFSQNGCHVSYSSGFLLYSALFTEPKQKSQY